MKKDKIEIIYTIFFLIVFFIFSTMVGAFSYQAYHEFQVKKDVSEFQIGKCYSLLNFNPFDKPIMNIKILAEKQSVYGESEFDNKIYIQYENLSSHEIISDTLYNMNALKHKEIKCYE